MGNGNQNLINQGDENENTVIRGNVPTIAPTPRYGPSKGGYGPSKGGKGGKRVRMLTAYKSAESKPGSASVP